jgi:choline monooxygenase
MFTSQTHLPHVLAPREYSSAQMHEREIERLFLPAWHCVGSLADLPREGDFFTVELLGHPLLVRRMNGEVHCFLNVCAHRHCLLTCEPRGNHPRLSCQYHGWEYDADGTTRRIPDARSFRPFSKEQASLKKYRTETCGQLIFVTLSDETPPLAEWLHPVFELIQSSFDQRWRQYFVIEPTIEANWKLPVENALESYHIDCVHQKTFGKFPPEESCRHDLAERYTAFHTHGRDEHTFLRWLEGMCVRASGRDPDYTYLHLHLYPHLLFSSTQMFSFVQTVIPLGPNRHRSIWRMFAWSGRGASLASRVGWWILSVWGRRFWSRVVDEDAGILPHAHRGMAAPLHPVGGMIATREERIWHFQQYIRQMCGDGSQAGDLLAARGAQSAAECGESQRLADPCQPCMQPADGGGALAEADGCCTPSAPPNNSSL